MRSQTLELRFKAFRLPSFLANYAEVAKKAERAGWGHLQYLEALAELEAEDRRNRRIQRLLMGARLPRDKTLGTLELARFPASVRSQVRALCEGQFLSGSTNVCVFGNPGTGKTHVVCAIGHELVRRGHSVLFTQVNELVERLLVAKRDLRLTRELRRLDRFECLILDDIGYVQQGREEMEVLFTLLSERYERRSVMITSNLVFSKWEQIFKDPMTTAAAIDRVVHHSAILELNVASYRAEAAQRGRRGKPSRAERYGEEKGKSYESQDLSQK
ncbi:MAG: IS21-like element helper ATPase IstB [Candidatus Binatia bacterium]